MIISVQRGLQAVKERLEQSGYKTVYSDEYAHPVDAFIYSSRGETGAFLTPEMSAARYMGTGVIAHGSRNSGGVIEINAAGMSFEEIDDALHRGRHTDYF